jgi:diguanylate cyclase (GGDEF)-like protein
VPVSLGGLRTAAALRRRSPQYRWTLGAALIIAAISFSYALMPPFDSTPQGTMAQLGLDMLAIGLLTYIVGPLVPDNWGLDAGLLLMGALAAFGSLYMSTAFGQAQIAMILQVIGVIAAYFRPQRRLLAMLVVWLIALAACLMAHPLTGRPINVVFLLLVVAVAPLAVAEVSQRLTDQAMHDPLTGLLNRRGLRIMAPSPRDVAERAGVPVTVAMADLDGFKPFNDSRGHREGDRVLVELADAWRRELRRGDLLARLGGDEFAFVLADAASEGQEAMVARLRKAYDFPFSIGFAAWASDEDLLTALDRADAQLYAEKKRGRQA